MMAVSLITEIWVWQGLFQERKLNFRYCLFPGASQNVFLLSPKTISLIHKFWSNALRPNLVSNDSHPLTPHDPLFPYTQSWNLFCGQRGQQAPPLMPSLKTMKENSFVNRQEEERNTKAHYKKLSFSLSKPKWMVKWMLLSKRGQSRSWDILKSTTAKSECWGTNASLDKWMKTKQSKKSWH